MTPTSRSNADSRQILAGLGAGGVVIATGGLAACTRTPAPSSLERWRIVNTGPSRYYALRLDGLPLHLIATDGGGSTRPPDR